MTILFEESGLPTTDMIKRAFAFAARAAADERISNIPILADGRREQYKEDIDELNALVALGEFKTQEEYNLAKKQVDDSFDEDINDLPRIAEEQADHDFVVHSVGVARILSLYSTNPPDELIAAALLEPYVTSFTDSEIVQKEFGQKVLDIVNAVSDNADELVERQTSLSEESPEVQKIELARAIIFLEEEADAISGAISSPDGENAVIIIPSDEDLEDLYNDIKGIWNIDEKLGTCLISTFNRLTELATSDYVLKVSDKGILELVDIEAEDPPLPALPAPPEEKPKKPRKPKDGGPNFDVF